MNRALDSVELQRHHSILATDWDQHEEQIRTTWGLLTPKERSDCFHSVLAAQKTLFIPGDPTHDADLMSEWNSSIAGSDAQSFLDLAESRATRSLYQQTWVPFKNLESDCSHIITMISQGQFKLQNCPRNQRMLIVGDKQDGAVLDVAAHATWLRELDQHGEYDVASLCSDLIAKRQLKFLMCISLMVCEILERDTESVGAQERSREQTNKKIEEMANSSVKPLSGPNRIERPLLARTLLPRLIARAIHFTCLSEGTKILIQSSTGEFAAHVGGYIIRQPVRGQMLISSSSVAVSAMIFDCMNDNDGTWFAWEYILELLCLLHAKLDKTFRHVVLQELSNVCQMVYSHTQDTVFRELSVGLAKDCFVPTSKVDQAGRVLLKLKNRPEKLATRGTLLHCLLCLVQPETSGDQALDLVNLAAVRMALGENSSLTRGEFQAVSKLIHVVAFIADLSLAFAMPSFSRKSGNLFVAEFQKVDAKMARARRHLDIDKFWRNFTYATVGPLVKTDQSLLRSCFAALDECTREYAGDSMSDAYEAVVNNCLARLKSRRCAVPPESQPCISTELSPPAPELNPPALPGPVACEAEEAATPAVHFAEGVAVPSLIKGGKREKAKKSKSAAKPQLEKPAHSPAKKPRQAKGPVDVSPSNKILVSASTAQVFSVLFDKSLSRSGLHWASFEAAMAELEFRITPRQGSSILFEPPASLGLGRSLTVHRPHGSRVEGFRTVILRQRLTRTYGWDDDTFVAR